MSSYLMFKGYLFTPRTSVYQINSHLKSKSNYMEKKEKREKIKKLGVSEYCSIIH